jgi:nickel/cobalt exporter
MEAQLTILIGAAAAIGFIHTLLGPDHYVPFVAMAQAGRWSKTKTLTVTVLCGFGHILGSVLLGVLGVILGWTVGSMESFESVRGEWAAWALIAFGIAYGAWGIRRGLRNKPHTHLHRHADGIGHAHAHTHHDDHAHVHTAADRHTLTPWILFTIFVLGPCEPLIPILMIPAAAHSWWGLALVATVFGVATVTTMTAVTLGLLYGLRFVPVRKLERWSHALAGFALFASGGAIQWLGL